MDHISPSKQQRNIVQLCTRLKRAREEAIFFFEEGRKLDKVAVETEEEKMRRKAAVYKDVEGVLVEQMGEKLKEKTRMEALKRLEQEERLGSEARVKEMEKEEMRKEQVGKMMMKMRRGLWTMG